MQHLAVLSEMEMTNLPCKRPWKITAKKELIKPLGVLLKRTGIKEKKNATQQTQYLSSTQKKMQQNVTEVLMYYIWTVSRDSTFFKKRFSKKKLFLVEELSL